MFTRNARFFCRQQKCGSVGGDFCAITRLFFKRKLSRGTNESNCLGNIGYPRQVNCNGEERNEYPADYFHLYSSSSAPTSITFGCFKNLQINGSLFFLRKANSSSVMTV